MRRETDFLGSIDLPSNVLYGSQSARAAANFDVEYRLVDMQIIHAIVLIKKAAAITYTKLNIGNKDVYSAIVKACDQVLNGKFNDQFITNAMQGGAGTSINMNVNEVLANISLLELGYKPGQYNIIHPIDDVNRGQSTNDVYSTAIRIATIYGLNKLNNECISLQKALRHRAKEFADIKKLGRTELMDAVPITLGDEFGAYADMISRDIKRLKAMNAKLSLINLGGTAVGKGDNANPDYCKKVISDLCNVTGLKLHLADSLFDITQNDDIFVEVSGNIKTLAIDLKKIANDLRLMNSGPNSGYGEIELMALQAGSTIMPSKVNPVLPEMIIQVAFKVIGNDLSIALAASHGEFELNAFKPLIADSLMQNIEILTDSITLFRNRCINLLRPNKERCLEILKNSYAFAIPYTLKLGYDCVSKVIKNNSGNPSKIKKELNNLISLQENSKDKFLPKP